MGTRADFYVAQDDGLEWLGSIAWDGYPEGIDSNVLTSNTAAEFGVAVDQFLNDCDDSTRPADGWPWPWADSKTTDFAYVLIEGEGVVFLSFGKNPYWANRFDADGDYQPAGVKIAFPDMSDRQNVALGSRSGTIIVGSPRVEA